MQNRDDVDGSQRPRTADAPSMKSAADEGDQGGYLGPAGSPVEGADGPQDSGSGSGEGSDHLGPGGDPVEGDPGAVEHQLKNTPAKE